MLVKAMIFGLSGASPNSTNKIILSYVYMKSTHFQQNEPGG